VTDSGTVLKNEEECLPVLTTSILVKSRYLH